MSANDDQQDHERRWFDSREFNRGGVEIYADIREHGGNKHKAHIIDLSPSGFRIRSSTHIRHTKTIFLTLPGFAALEAHIIWHEKDIYGCEFISRLHIAIYDHLLTTFPSLAPSK